MGGLSLPWIWCLWHLGCSSIQVCLSLSQHVLGEAILFKLTGPIASFLDLCQESEVQPHILTFFSLSLIIFLRKMTSLAIERYIYILD